MPPMTRFPGFRHFSMSWAGVLIVIALWQGIDSVQAQDKVAPVFEQQPLFVAGEGGYFNYRIPSLAVTARGTILAFCEARKNNGHDWDNIDLALRRSTDHGRTWSKMQIIGDEGDLAINQPCPVVDHKTGTIWLPMCRGSKPGQGNTEILLMKSTDDGESWSPPVSIHKSVANPSWTFVGTGPGHGIQLKTGRLLIPFWFDATPTCGEVQSSCCFYSDDHGETWKQGEPLTSNASDECDLVELTDGTVYLNARSRGPKQRAYAFSQDGGHRWSEVKNDPNQPEPSCDGALIRLTDNRTSDKNRVLVACPTNPDTRAQIRIRMSTDECQTWPIASEPLAHLGGYSDLAVTGDRQILCLYESWPSDQELAAGRSSLVLARCNVEWLTNGTDSLGTATQKDVAQEAARGLTASVTRPVHPILVRNEYGPLLRVALEVEKGVEARLNSLVFNLDGTDDLSDLESLTLFNTGDKEAFAPDAPVGEPVLPAATVTFHVDQPLHEGKNVFWLSCRLKAIADLHHRIATACPSVVTSAGKVTPGDDSEAVWHRIGVALRKHNDDGVHTYRIPALTTSTKGTLLAAYDMRRRMGRDLQEDIDIGLSRSTDGGRTWEPVKVIMDMGEYGGLPHEQNGCSDPGIIVDEQTGEIFCFAVWMNGKPGKHQWNDDGSEPGFEIGKAAQFMMVRSKDDGLTWSMPENLTRRLKQESWWLLAPAPQSGFTLADGTLVMPVQGRSGKGPLETFATLMISRDHGATWTVGEPGYTGGNECQAAQLGDGSIMLNVRNDHERFRAVVVTNDLGQTWKPHATHRNTLIEPNCNGSLLRMDYEQAGEKKHVLVFANPHTQKGRTHHTLQVSFDDGGTWPDSHHLLLDEGLGAGYPSLTRIDRDHIGIVYEGSQSHLVFEKFTLVELLEPTGRIAARDVWQRVVSKEGTQYLERLRQGSPFGTNRFDLAGLRAGMGTRNEPAIPGVKLQKVTVGDVPCEWVVAPGADPDVRLLYLHGGGWVSGSGGNYLPLAADISVKAKCAVLLPDYRLAPEHPFPAGLDDCVAAHDWMVANGPAGPTPARTTFIAGDSAGGNLTLATLLALRDRKRPLPAGGIAISPATDFTLASESLKSVHDPIISSRTMPEFRDRYLGNVDPHDPLVSPVFGDFQGLPPLLIQTGEHEMLRDDSIRVTKKARADGIRVQLEIWPGMVHVFQIRGLPESREAIERIAEFVRSHQRGVLDRLNDPDSVSVRFQD